MQFPFPFFDVLTIPFGVTTGRRIEIDGINGTITFYRTDDTVAIVLGGTGADADTIRFPSGDVDELIGGFITSSILGAGGARNLLLLESAPAFNSGTQFPSSSWQSQSEDLTEPPVYVIDHDGSEGRFRIPAVVGSATLVAGTIAVARTSILANSRVLLSRRLVGAAPGFLSYVLTAGVGFTINSTNAGDTGTITWAVFDE